jgi:hypothetical protein
VHPRSPDRAFDCDIFSKRNLKPTGVIAARPVLTFSVDIVRAGGMRGLSLRLVRPAGIEPATFRSGGERSIP